MARRPALHIDALGESGSLLRELEDGDGTSAATSTAGVLSPKAIAVSKMPRGRKRFLIELCDSRYFLMPMAEQKPSINSCALALSSSSSSSLSLHTHRCSLKELSRTTLRHSALCSLRWKSPCASMLSHRSASFSVMAIIVATIVVSVTRAAAAVADS